MLKGKTENIKEETKMLQFNRTNEQMGTYSLDGENHFPRIERLLERYWECTPEVDIERAKI